jgi:murein DD-endopeptidase MepM/ murein hydrolase activator NlpD
VKSERYTVMIIPEQGEGSRQFSISRRGVRWVVVIAVLILIGLLGWNIYTVPKVLDYDDLHRKYERLAGERLEVMALMQDLQRMKQMDQIIRKTLGTELQVASGPDQAGGDTLPAVPGIVPEERVHLSYIENIPSLAPLMGYVTQRMDRSSLYYQQNHYGIDIAARTGEPVLAAASGYVVFSGWTHDMGNIVILYHGDGYFTYYGHNQRNLVQQHEFVRRGEVLAHAGSTGISSGPHLHFEIWHNGTAVDPLEFFPEYRRLDVSPAAEPATTETP